MTRRADPHAGLESAGIHSAGNTSAIKSGLARRLAVRGGLAAKSFAGLPKGHCNAHKLPVSVHCGHEGPSHTDGYRLEYANPLLLQEVLEKYDDLVVVIDHLGYPYVRESIHLAYTFQPRVYLCTSVIFRLSPEAFHDVLSRVVRELGTDQIIFGSEPCHHPNRMADGVDLILEADYLTDEQKHQILWENPKKVFGFDAIKVSTGKQPE